YDAFQVLFAAMKEVGTDTDKMKEYIAGLENFDTVTGTLIRYNKDGSAVKPVQIQLVQKGEYHSAGIIDDMKIIDPANY
ncbi:MAG: receptor, partial [Clostridia bacterium]|nr:receptor [Clostridia bacterium]